MLRLAVVAAILVLATGLALPPVAMLDGRIVGGDPVDIKQVPFQAALLLDVFNTGIFTQVCGGSIISKTKILTAAHCTNGTTAAQWRIRVGSSQHNTGGEVVSVSRIIQHAGFNSYLDNDISLVYLASGLTIGNGVGTVTLPAQGTGVVDGVRAVVTGWGTLTEGGASPTDLYKVNVTIVNQQMCMYAYDSYNPVTKNMICAGRLGVGGVDACQGDSGGPLTVGGLLIGITSWGKGCAQPQYPGVYTRVPEFKSWIIAHTLT